MRLTQLKNLAEAATQDPHLYGSVKCNCGHPMCHNWHLNIGRSNGGIDESDALFIAAANPATLLSMIALIEQMKEALVNCEGAFDECRNYPVTHDLTIEALAAYENFGGE